MSDGQFNPLKITGVTVTWEVENIWNLSFDGVSSASFLLSDHIFHLFVRRYELSIAVYLCRDDAIPTALSLLCSLCMLDHVGQETAIGEKEMQISKGKEVVLIDSINIDTLENQKEELLVNDTLVIRCNVSASYKRNVLRVSDSDCEETIHCYETLSSDFGNLLGNNPDAVLKVGGTEFSVHRTVLRARCPAIVSLLDDVDQSTQASIEDVQSPVFRDVLNYLYTGRVCGLRPDTAVPMLTAAGRFGLSELEGVCRRYLLRHLSDDNVFEAAVLAFEGNGDALKEEVKRYIVGNLSTILHSDQWKEFCQERYRHANEILTHVLLRMQQNEALKEES